MNIAVQAVYYISVLVVLLLGSRYYEQDAVNEIFFNPIIYIALVIGTGACIYWWKLAKDEITNEDLSKSADGSTRLSLRQLLEGALKELKAIYGSGESLSESEICKKIEYISDTYCSKVGDHKNRVMIEYGTAMGAQILIKAAYGERYTNRVYSCAADGHRGELMASLPEAILGYEESLDMLKK